MNISSYGFKSRPEYQAQNPCFYRGFRVFSLDFFNMKKDENATNEHRNGHRFFEFSMKKKRYSNPKIYIPRKNGRPSVSAKSRWHVYFYWRTEKDGTLDKLFTFRKDINRLKTPAERNAAAKSLQSALQVALDRGWNPLTNTTIEQRSSRDSMLLKEALEFSYKILSNRISVAIGLISYSLYLWHFPVFAFARIKDNTPSQYDKFEWIILTIVLSIITYFLIEVIFRNKKISKLSAQITCFFRIVNRMCNFPDGVMLKTGPVSVLRAIERGRHHRD